MLSGCSGQPAIILSPLHVPSPPVPYQGSTGSVLLSPVPMHHIQKTAVPCCHPSCLHSAPSLTNGPSQIPGLPSVLRISFYFAFSSYTFKVNFTLSASICKIPAHFMPGSLIHCLFTFFVPYAVFAFTLSGVWTVSKNVLPSTRSSPISTFTAFAVFPVLVNLWVVEIPVYVIS